MLNNLPNVITLIRIVLAPVIAAILWQPPSAFLGALALGLFCFAGFSDWLDGWMARRLNIVSSVGRMLDPIADKLLIAACLIAFAAQRGADVLFLVPALIILFREFLVSGLRESLLRGGKRWTAKKEREYQELRSFIESLVMRYASADQDLAVLFF